jgi:hypothetical protein
VPGYIRLAPASFNWSQNSSHDVPVIIRLALISSSFIPPSFCLNFLIFFITDNNAKSNFLILKEFIIIAEFATAGKDKKNKMTDFPKRYSQWGMVAGAAETLMEVIAGLECRLLIYNAAYSRVKPFLDAVPGELDLSFPCRGFIL